MSDRRRFYNESKGAHDITRDIELKKRSENVRRIIERSQNLAEDDFPKRVDKATDILKRSKNIEFEGKEDLKDLIKKYKVEQYKRNDALLPNKETPSNPLKNQVFDEFVVKFKNGYAPKINKGLPAAAVPTAGEVAAAVALPIAAFLYPNSVATDDEEIDHRFQNLMESMNK